MRADEPKQLKFGYSMFAGDNGNDNYTNTTIRVGDVESEHLLDPNYPFHKKFYKEEIGNIRKEENGVVQWG